MAELWQQHVGQVADGVFPLVEYLGGGQDRAVFLTEREGGKAAIKLVRADSRSSESQLARWKRAAKLCHPHLIRLFSAGECQLGDSPFLYAVMEYAAEDVSQVLPERPLTAAETREMLGSALDALAYLHGEGFVHRHLKPSNIMAVGDQVKLSSDGVRRTGEENAAPADDVWALGATMAEALTQRPPTLGETGEVVLPAALEEPFLDIALHTLRRDPKERWTVFDISARLQGHSAPQGSSRKWQYAIPGVVVGAAAVAMMAGRGLFTSRPEASPPPAVEVELPKAAPEVDRTPAPPPQQAKARREPRKAEPEPSRTGNAAQGVRIQVLPKVPQKARDTIRGRVRVNVRVHTDPAGNVTDATAEPSASRYFSGLSVHAAQQWKFQPADAPQEWNVRFEFRRTETTAVPERVGP